MRDLSIFIGARHLAKWLLGNLNITLGVIIVGLFVILSIGAHAVAPYDSLEMHLDHKFEGPNAQFLLGTDQYGRDELSRVIVGARFSLSISASVVILGGTVGALMGLLGGFLGGWIDEVFMRLSDVILAFPSLLLAITILAVVGTNASNLIIALSIVYVPLFARMARAPVLSIREELFVEAARSIGGTKLHIIFQHILPNLGPILIFQYTLSLSTVLITESALSFLWLGAQPPNASWGVMLSESRDFMLLAPWMAISPGLAIVLAVFGFNLLGDGLQDVLR